MLHKQWRLPTQSLSIFSGISLFQCLILLWTCFVTTIDHPCLYLWGAVRMRQLLLFTTFCRLLATELKSLFLSTPRCPRLWRLLKLPQNMLGPVGVWNLLITVTLFAPFSARQTGLKSESLQVMAQRVTPRARDLSYGSINNNGKCWKLAELTLNQIQTHLLV